MPQFYGRLDENAFFLQEKAISSMKFRVLGGVYFGFWGGGSADFIFMGARIFLKGAKTGKGRGSKSAQNWHNLAAHNWKTANGGGKRIVRFWGGGGNVP